MAKPIAHLIVNFQSGQGKGADLAKQARQICRENGYELIEHFAQNADEIREKTQEGIEQAMSDQGVLIAAGGDGTIRGVAQLVKGKPVKFGVVPCGTFNFFARAYNIPENPEEALRLALRGEARPIRLGEVNGEVFLINATMGLYVNIIREREERTRRLGRRRVVAIFSTILTLLRRHHLIRVDLHKDGKKAEVWTPMIFVGNNSFQLRNLSMDVADCMSSQQLGVVLARPITRWQAFKLVVRGAFGRLNQADQISTFCIDEMTVVTQTRRNTVALDGEMFNLHSPLRFRAIPGAIQLVVASEKAA